jgi:hypothetical protein
MNHPTHPPIKALGVALNIAVLAAAASIAPAQAADVPGQDWTGYAGTNCQPHLPSDPIRRSAVNQIALANTGTSTITVYCPVVRNDPAGGANGVAAVAVRFRNRNATVAGRCEFVSYDQTGTRIAAKSAAAPFGETTLQLGPLNAHNWGAYVLICQIPGRDPASGLQSYIVNYRVDETL